MCNGGEGRTLKPCCDAALASSRYISNGPAKAHSLPTLPSALPPLNPSLPGPPRLALAGLPPSFASTRSPFPSPSSPGPIALARARARAPASTIPVLGVLLPHSWVPSRRAAETLGREVEYERPYTNHRATVLPGLILSLPFSLLLPPSLSVTLPPPSRSHPPPLLFLRLLSPLAFLLPFLYPSPLSFSIAKPTLVISLSFIAFSLLPFVRL